MTGTKRNHEDAVALDEKFALFDEPFAPRRVGHLNGQAIKLAHIQGAFLWHVHHDFDELFLVHQGALQVHYRDRVVTVPAGSFHVVPRGEEHMTASDEGAEVLILTASEVRNTGDRASSERTRAEEPFI